ncbi:hypothetical protein PHYSODRAFT_484860, partial [Phytophthora sojae]
AARRSSPFACWAPPRRKECEVRSGVAPAGSATRLSILFTYACTLVFAALDLTGACLGWGCC